MLDVSDAVDLLFTGVVPERAQELKHLWGDDGNRVRLLPTEGFLLHQLPGTNVIQVNEIALRQIWLIGFAAWDAVDAYAGVMRLLLMSNQPFEPACLKVLDRQMELDAKFDRALKRVQELGRCGSVDEFEWPKDVPEPTIGLKIRDIAQKAIFELVCIAGGFVFLHEIRHGILDRDGKRPVQLIDEERECDQFARIFITSEVRTYSAQTGDSEIEVRAKRLLGIVIALLTILVVTPRQYWGKSSSHPSVRERIETVLKSDACKHLSETFWLTCASMLGSFARHFGLLSDSIPFANFEELALSICEVLP